MDWKECFGAAGVRSGGGCFSGMGSCESDFSRGWEISDGWCYVKVMGHRNANLSGGYSVEVDARSSHLNSDLSGRRRAHALTSPSIDYPCLVIRIHQASHVPPK